MLDLSFPSFDYIVQNRLRSASMVIFLLVTSLNSDLKESLHKDLKSAKGQLAGVDRHIDHAVEHILHLFNDDDHLVIYISLSCLIFLSLLQLCCLFVYQECTDISFCKIYDQQTAQHGVVYDTGRLSGHRSKQNTDANRMSNRIHSIE